MSIKNLCVGFALAAASVVLAPTTGQANGSHSSQQGRGHEIEQRKGRIERSQHYRDKFHDMRQKRWKHKKKDYHGNDLVGVPELDPNGVGAAATLLLGGVLVAQGRRRRLQFA